ncbi:hypothetical protein HELRODRAFT_88252 [Helobdella robusta]|uniref:Gamma-glutamylcyclotransferase family protein n=1 Tax=Helobdella robusta TaxID=6412 RepID=T1G706_HELRO|nr:hypothetical protein HELRODRAFT_88252 [Helobdella robusta]ESN93726.1 hypothetical protein HELRODRAFT_88252 [Helobdella robusta]
MGEYIKIFVYGTLKRGYPNNIFFNNSSLGYARFICKGKTEVKYPLVVATRWKLPFLLFAPDIGKNIEGDIYEIDNKFLSWLDDFEGHPFVYQRQQIFITCSLQPSSPSFCQKIPCWVYFLMKFPPKTLEKPHLSWYEQEEREEYDFRSGLGLVRLVRGLTDWQNELMKEMIDW